MIVFVFFDTLIIFIGLFNIVINFISDFSNLICTVTRRIYRYRLRITRTNKWCMIALQFFLFALGIFIDSIIYIDIILCRISSNNYWIISICFFLFSGSMYNRRTSSGSRRTSSGSMYNRRTWAHKIQRGPQQYTCCTYTQFTNTKSLLNSSNNSISHSSLFLSILDYSHSLFFSAYLLKNNQNIFQ